MAKRPDPVRNRDDRRRGSREPAQRRAKDAPPRNRRSTREQRPPRSAPHTSPIPRITDAPARPKNAAQAKARSKARKAKAPKVIRPPLRERLLVKLASIDLDPRRLVTRVPFVVLVIGALGLGLAVTLWLSTDAAERSYQLGHVRETNQALLQQKEALERDVLEAQAAPALAEAARNLGMIPSRDTAHLVQDPTGNWMVVGTPKPAQGVQPPPLERAAARGCPAPTARPARAPRRRPKGGDRSHAAATDAGAQCRGARACRGPGGARRSPRARVPGVEVPAAPRRRARPGPRAGARPRRPRRLRPTRSPPTLPGPPPARSRPSAPVPGPPA